MGLLFVWLVSVFFATALRILILTVCIIFIGNDLLPVLNIEDFILTPEQALSAGAIVFLFQNVIFRRSKNGTS